MVITHFESLVISFGLIRHYLISVNSLFLCFNGLLSASYVVFYIAGLRGIGIVEIVRPGFWNAYLPMKLLEIHHVLFILITILFAEVCLNEKQWNDGLLATLREQVWPGWFIEFLYPYLSLHLSSISPLLLTFTVLWIRQRVTFGYMMICQVHMEAERKAKPGHASISARPQERITYKIGNKVINI